MQHQKNLWLTKDINLFFVIINVTIFSVIIASEIRSVLLLTKIIFVCLKSCTYLLYIMNGINILRYLRLVIFYLICFLPVYFFFIWSLIVLIWEFIFFYFNMTFQFCIQKFSEMFVIFSMLFPCMLFSWLKAFFSGDKWCRVSLLWKWAAAFASHWSPICLLIKIVSCM